MNASWVYVAIEVGASIFGNLTSNVLILGVADMSASLYLAVGEWVYISEHMCFTISKSSSSSGKFNVAKFEVAPLSLLFNLMNIIILSRSCGRIITDNG